MKMPGMTMSPRPNMAKLLAPIPFSSRSCGNTTGTGGGEMVIHQQKYDLIYQVNIQKYNLNLRLIGASKDLATVTITLVPNT